MPKPTSKRTKRYHNPGHDGAIGPGFLFGQVIGVSSFLIVTLLLAISLLYTLWPGGQWVVAWYESDQQRAAATTVAETGAKRLAETLNLLARLDDPQGNPLTTAQTTNVNLDLVYAEELKTHRCATCTPFVSAETADSTKAKPDTWAPLGTTLPTSRQLSTLRTHITEAKALLLCRLVEVQRPPKRPTLGDLLFMRLPARCPDCSTRASQPLPSEADVYAKALTEAQAARGAYFLGSSELNYLVIIGLFGALGSCLRALASLTRFVGNASFQPRWVLYYLCQPLLGSGLAIAFYILLRGGFMKTETSAADVTNLYSCAAFAVLVGVSIREAMTKIQNVAGQFFAVKDEDKDRVGDTRADSTMPIIQDVQLRPDGFSGSITGLRLNEARKLYVGAERRALTILASGPTSLFFQVGAGEPPLTQNDLRSVIVETPAGASGAYDDTTPDSSIDSPSSRPAT